MDASLRQIIERAIGKATGQDARIVRLRHAEGGCINHASVADVEDGRRFFLKWNSSLLPGLFQREAEGLEALAEARCIRVPHPISTSDDSTRDATAFIVMEYIPTGAGGPTFFEDLGTQFAQLHHGARNQRFGFPHDNYLGSTPQPNPWCGDWVEFWRENRLRYQLDLARRTGAADAMVNRLGDKLLERLDDLIGEPRETPCLLHGDLWRGNYLADIQGRPVLIDPAAYYGRREADLAMTLLFGGFDAQFYAAYNEAWPLADESEVRLDVYKLYHLLNHLNLFGSGYRSQCVTILKRYAGQ